MSEISHPILEKGKIIKALLLSITIAVMLLITAVLPAEFGIDPIGAGRLLGFSKLYNPSGQPEAGVVGAQENAINPLIKMEKAGSGPEVPRPAEADNPPPAEQLPDREDEVKVVVAAGKGIEYKMNMLKYGTVKYEWVTDTGIVYFDFHGEVKQEKETKDVFFESYTIAYSNNMVGTFHAPFEGRHGWYFRNNSNKDVTVSLRLKGQYRL